MNPCSTCAAPCCRQYFVTIDGFDVYRIATGLKLPVSDFASLRWATQASADFRILLDGRTDPLERRFFGLALAKKPDPDPAFEERCVFLMSVGKEGRCGIYDQRPGVCRVYPTTFENGLVALGGGGRFCPPGSWQMDDLDTELFRGRWQSHRVHHWLHQELIDGWNERLVCYGEERTADEYFLFLLRAYAELERASPSLFETRLVGWPPAEVKAMADSALRAIAWRNEETITHSDPRLGWVWTDRPESLRLEPANDGVDTVLVLDENEELDPEGAHLAKLLGR